MRSAVSFNEPLLPDGGREGFRFAEAWQFGRHRALSLLWWRPVGVFCEASRRSRAAGRWADYVENQKLNISLNYVDHDFHELRIAAANGIFAGKTTLFAHPNSIHELADGLQHFPDGPGARFEWCAGIGNVQSKLIFVRPGWRAAHVTVALDRGDGTTRDEHGDYVQLTIAMTDATFGEFVDALRRMLGNQSGTASLFLID